MQRYSIDRNGIFFSSFFRLLPIFLSSIALSHCSLFIAYYFFFFQTQNLSSDGGVAFVVFCVIWFVEKCIKILCEMRRSGWFHQSYSPIWMDARHHIVTNLLCIVVYTHFWLSAVRVSGFFPSSYIFVFCFQCLFFRFMFYVCTACHNASRSHSNEGRTTQVLWEMNFRNREDERNKNDERPHRQWWAIFSQTNQLTLAHLRERWNAKEIIYINCILNVLFFVPFVHWLDYIEIKRVNEQTWSSSRESM